MPLSTEKRLAVVQAEHEIEKILKALGRVVPFDKVEVELEMGGNLYNMVNDVVVTIKPSE